MKLITMHNNTNMDKFDSFLRKQMEQMPSTLPLADKVMDQMNFPKGPATITKAFNFKKWGLSFLSLAAICTLLYFAFFNKNTTTANSNLIVIKDAPANKLNENENEKTEPLSTTETSPTNIINSQNTNANANLNQNAANIDDNAIVNNTKSLVPKVIIDNSKNSTSINNDVIKNSTKNTTINAALLSNSEASNSLVRSNPISSNVYVKKDSSNLSKLKKVAMPVKDTIQILW